jgi:hypothetical protein
LKKMATLQAFVNQHNQHQAAQQIQQQMQAPPKPPPSPRPAADADQRFQSPPRFLEHTQRPPSPDAVRATTPVPSKDEHDARSFDAKQPQPMMDMSKANGAKTAVLDGEHVRFVSCVEHAASSAALAGT